MYRLDGAGLSEARKVVDGASTRLEAELDGDPSRYLVSDRLTLADICAAALLSPVVGPPGSLWAELPPDLESLHELRRRARERVSGQWVMWVYTRDRQQAAGAGTTARTQETAAPLN
jgi:glutathione S-transferase